MRKQFEKILGLLIVVSIIPVLAFAGPFNPVNVHTDVPFTLGQPEVEGSGCPDADSVSAILSEDGNELTILFNQFTAETSPTKTFNFSNCNVAVPIEVPAGIMVGLLGVDYRGLAFVPQGGMGIFSREYFFAGAKSSRISTPITVRDEFYEFYYPDSLKVAALSHCGDDIVARSNATLMVSKPTPDSPDAFMTMFSEDWDMSILFHLSWKECEED